MSTTRHQHAVEPLTAAWVITVIIVAATVLGLHWMNVTRKSPPPQIRVDTVHSVVYDTVIVVSRALDTVRLVEHNVGPLTQERLVHLVCGSDRTYGDTRDRFDYNKLGMVFCPK